MKQSTVVNNDIINRFSAHLFWDVDRDKLDWNKHLAFIIERVLEYGLLADWKLLRSCVSVQEIAEYAKTFRQLDPRTLAFISAISQTPKDDFRCCTMKQSNPVHWNF